MSRNPNTAVNGIQGTQCKRPWTPSSFQWTAPRFFFPLCFSLISFPPACVHMSIPFWFHSLRLQLLSRLKFTNIIERVCIPNLALQLHITMQLHIQKKHFQSHTLYKLSPLFSQKPKESRKEIVHVHRTCSARLSHSDLSDLFPLLWHYSDLPFWISRTTCSPCPYSQFLTIWQLPKSAPIFSAWNSTSSPSFLAGTFSSRKDHSSFCFMCLYVTTGWLAVRSATIIDCFSLHPTKHPSLGILCLLPLLVTFFPPPDPNSPALLVSPIPPAVCYIFTKERDSISASGYKEALTIYYVIIRLL